MSGPNSATDSPCNVHSPFKLGGVVKLELAVGPLSECNSNARRRPEQRCSDIHTKRFALMDVRPSKRVVIRPAVGRLSQLSAIATTFEIAHKRPSAYSDHETAAVERTNGLPRE
jgi:hypothetical protein